MSSTAPQTQDKLPPQDLEAERSVLGSLMLDKNAIVRVADIVVAEDFYRGAHQEIYLVALKLFERGEPIDIISLSSELRGRNKLDDIGGSSYLAELVNSVATPAHIVHYARTVRKNRVLRDLIGASYEISELAFNSEESVDKVLDQAEAKVFAISQKSLRRDFIPVKNDLQEAFERIDRLHKGGGALRGLSTGFHDLDMILGGLQRSDLVILAARPSLGKTALSLDMARTIAKKEKVPVGIFSLEMAREQVADRLLAAEAHVDLWRLRTGRLSSDGSPNDFDLIRGAMSRLSDMPIFVDDAPYPDILTLRTMSRRLQAEHGLGIIIVDYLQLLRAGRDIENRVQEVTEISRGLKSLAKELDIPVLAVSQLSRAPEHRTEQRPKLSDLRESGALEQDADVVLFIWREDRVKREASKNIASIIVAKHRNGPLGTVDLYFNEGEASFSSVEKIQAGEEIGAEVSAEEELL